MDKEKQDKIDSLINESRLQEAEVYLLTDLHVAVEKYVEEHHRTTQNDSDIHLAHYTGIETIYSMITNHKKIAKEHSSAEKEDDGIEKGNAEEKERILPGYLRLYDALSFNDPEEGVHIKSEIQKEHKWLENAKQDTDTFICSFVSDVKGIGNKVIYWNSSYGRYGFGCSIEIPLEFIQHESIDVGHVLYQKGDTKKIEDYFQNYFGLGKSIFTKIDNAKKTEFATAFLEKFDAIKFLYKHAGYEGEKEYRVIVSSETYNGPAKHELVNEGPRLKRYIEHPALATDKLLNSGSKITIGPRVPDSEYLRRHLEKLARKADLHGPEFTISKIPYR